MMRRTLNATWNNNIVPVTLLYNPLKPYEIEFRFFGAPKETWTVGRDLLHLGLDRRVGLDNRVLPYSSISNGRRILVTLSDQEIPCTVALHFSRDDIFDFLDVTWQLVKPGAERHDWDPATELRNIP